MKLPRRHHAIAGVPRLAVLLAAPLCATLVPKLAGAQQAIPAPAAPRGRTFVERLSIRAEITGGGNDQGYRGSQDPGFNLNGAVRGGIEIVPLIAAELGFEVHGFLLDPSPRTNLVFAGTAGIRIQPLTGQRTQLFFEGHAGYGGAADGGHFLFDVGIGAEFQITPNIHLGPVARFGRIFGANSNAANPDRELWQLGVVFSFRAPNFVEPKAEEAKTDQDKDGVLDDDDQCKTVPAGDHPDPNRKGCPVGDTDGDGVLDDTDQCKTAAAGDHPDPVRVGCPLGDADGDNVFDNVDLCANVPAGDHPDPDRLGCPDADDDGDGVFNRTDQCPAQPAGPNPDPDKAGCPIADSDSDTVPDAVDHCPNQPGAPDPNPQRNGCPGLVTIQQGQIRISQQVFFGPNLATILPQSFPVLQAVANALKASPNVRKVQVSGHTDDMGPDAANLTLSQNRANSVRTWLIAHGVEQDRLTAQGFGETQPLDPIRTTMTPAELTAARGKNRRVEFVITDPPPSATPPAATP